MEKKVVKSGSFTKNEYSNYKRYSESSKFNSPDEEYDWALTQYKNCSKCGEFKNLNEYGFNTAGRDPFDANGYRLRRPECKDCNKKITDGKNKAKKIAEKLGLPTKAPDGTNCELCGSIEKIVFDHDHDSEKFRGWLCDPCNRSQGLLETRIGSNWIDKLKEYHKKENEKI
jgi:transposase-like protein